jgi:hypothetical protein
MGEKGNACRLLEGKPEENRQPRKPKRKWVDNIQLDFGVIE